MWLAEPETGPRTGLRKISPDKEGHGVLRIDMKNPCHPVRGTSYVTHIGKNTIMRKKISADHETCKLGIFLSIELLIKGTFLGGYPDEVGIMMHASGETIVSSIHSAQIFLH